MGTETDTTTSDTDTDETPDPGDSKDWKADAEKWKKLARKHEGRANAALTELDKVKADAESTSKSDMDKLRATIEELKHDLGEERRKSMIAEIANERGLTPAQAKRLTGKTREELEADADDMVETFGIKAPDKGDDTTTETNGDTGNGDKPSSGRPKEKLRPGAAGESGDDEIDPAKIAEAVLKRPF